MQTPYSSLHAMQATPVNRYSLPHRQDRVQPALTPLTGRFVKPNLQSKDSYACEVYSLGGKSFPALNADVHKGAPIGSKTPITYAPHLLASFNVGTVSCFFPVQVRLHEKLAEWSRHYDVPKEYHCLEDWENVSYLFIGQIKLAIPNFNKKQLKLQNSQHPLVINNSHTFPYLLSQKLYPPFSHTINLNTIPHTSTSCQYRPLNSLQKSLTAYQFAMELSDDDFLKKFASLPDSSLSHPHQEAVTAQHLGASTQWANCLLCKVISINQRPTPTAIFIDQMNQAWKLYPFPSVKLISKNLFLVEFSSQADLLRVLHDGPWSVRGDLIAVKRVEGLKDVHDEFITHVDLWVQFHGVGIELLSTQDALLLAQAVGQPLLLPQLTSVGGKTYYKAKVSMPLVQPLYEIMQVLNSPMGPIHTFIVYEKVFNLCSVCGSLNHEYPSCSHWLRINRMVLDPVYANRPELQQLSPNRIRKWVTSNAMLPPRHAMYAEFQLVANRALVLPTVHLPYPNSSSAQPNVNQVSPVPNGPISALPNNNTSLGLPLIKSINRMGQACTPTTHHDNNQTLLLPTTTDPGAPNIQEQLPLQNAKMLTCSSVSQSTLQSLPIMQLSGMSIVPTMNQQAQSSLNQQAGSMDLVVKDQGLVTPASAPPLNATMVPAGNVNSSTPLLTYEDRQRKVNPKRARAGSLPPQQP